MPRMIVTPDEMALSKPSAARCDSTELLLFCEDATSAIESAVGKHYFAGPRVTDVLPTGGYFARLPDPPIVSIQEVKENGTGDALDLESFKIEDAADGLIWCAYGWRSLSFYRSAGSELDRQASQGFPGSVSGEAPPLFWRVKYTSGNLPPARVRMLARELVSLKLDRLNRQGVTSEAIGRQMTRAYDFDAAEKSILARAKRLSGSLPIR